MATCSACSVTVECNDGCGVVCVDDCGICTFWCEPTTLPADSAYKGTLVQLVRAAGGTTVVRVHEDLDKPIAPHDDDKRFELCFKDLPIASLARLLGSMSKRRVFVSADKAD
jgi:hypothetical protein